MQAKDFVENLKNLIPPKESLIKYGLSDEEIIGIQRSFLAEQRTTEIKHSANPLISLIENYDTSTLEIGLVRFFNHPSEIVQRGNFWRIGYVDADWLVINRKTNQVGVELHDCDGEESYKCAQDSEKFLDALYEAAQFVFSEERTQSRNCQQAKICAGLAGGDDYSPFYKMLLLCDE